MTNKNLHTNLVKIGVHAENWEDAIHHGGELLVKERKVEPSYVKAMIENIKKLGPYVIIAPGVALPHARPEDGVLEMGISVVILQQPVLFGKDPEQYVQLIICLAATDNSSHIELLKEIAGVISDVTTLNELKQARSAQEVLRLFKKGGKS